MNCWLTGWLHKREIKKQTKKTSRKSFPVALRIHKTSQPSTSWAEWCYMKSIVNPQVTPRKLQDTQIESRGVRGGIERETKPSNQAHTTIDSPLRMYKICSLFLSVLVLQLNLRPRTLSVSMARKTFLMLFFFCI